MIAKDAASTSRRPASKDNSEAKRAQAHAHYAAGVIHEMNDEAAAALDDYYQAALNDPDNEWLVLEVSRRFIQSKQPEKALEVLSRATERPDASGAILARLGLVYSQLGKYDQAAAADRAAIKRAPELLAGYQNLFLNYLQTKQETEALKVLDEAARQPNADAEFLIALADLYGNFILQAPTKKDQVKGKALAVLNRAEKLNPRNPSLRLRLADGFNLAGDSAKAAQVYLDLLKTLPDLPFLKERVHARLADIYLRESDRPHATEQLQAIIRDDPTNPEAYYRLGYLANLDQKPTEAAEYFSKTILLSPDFEPAYYDLALAQIGQNKADDALLTLEKARKRFQKNFVLEYCTAVAYSQQKAYAQALPHFTEAEVIANASDPKRLDERFYFQVGAAYERSGDYAQAEAYFQKCLQHAPDFAEALNYLGYMWAEHGLKLDEARKLIEKALKIQPDNAAYLDSLGWVFYKQNQPQKALEYILKAVQLSKEPDATVFDHLGDIYAALKQPDKAREAWTKSLALESNDQVRKKLEAPKP